MSWPPPSAALPRGSGIRARWTYSRNFTLPDSAWRDDYHRPILARREELNDHNTGIDLFSRYPAGEGHSFFVLRKEGRLRGAFM